MVDGSPARDQRDRPIEFGRTADDYGRYRPAFPGSSFESLTRCARMRACNGVGATLAPPAVEAFDRDLANLLDRVFPGDLLIPHRVFVATGVRAKDPAGETVQGPG